MSTFSYAQAAKGQLATTSGPQSVTSQAASTTDNQTADAPAAAGEAVASQSTAASTTSNDADVKPSDTQSASHADSQNKTESDATSQSTPAVESTSESTATDAAVSAAPEKKQGAETPDRRVKAASARSDTSDNRKPRKGKKSKTTDKESDQEQTTEKEKEPEAPKVQLSEAPIPAVNFWVQRAKEASTKTPQSAPARTTATAQDSKAKTATNDADSTGRSASVGKAQKKDASKDTAEQGARRHASRGSKVTEKAAGESLPSVADASSWPTPDTAATEIKSETAPKPAEKEEVSEAKGDSGSKEKPKWVAVPFVPSAVFETPLPSRNPRGSKTGAPRGGRETGARGHAGMSNSAERTQAPGAARASGDKFVDGAKAATAAPAKRASVDAGVSRDVRKASGAVKEGSNATAPVNGVDEPTKAAQSDSKDLSQTSETTEKRSETRPDPASQAFTPAAAKDNTHHHATKSEKRNNRGRGGHPGANGRGHGGFGANGQAFSGHMNSRQNSYPGNAAMGYGMPQTNGHSARNSTSGNFYRGGGRNGRGNNVQATNWNADPSMQAMPIMPPQQFYYEQQNILSLLTRQLSYYFSLDNLLKDQYLRRCMDSQGYVYLDVIMNFQRIQSLSTDPNMVRFACLECPEVELVTGMEDSRDRIRRVKQWNQFVYPTGQRNDGVQHDEGPINVYKHDRNSLMAHTYMAHHYPVDPQGFYAPNGQFPVYGNDSYQPYGGAMNGVNGHAQPNGANGTPLSADVPEFSPKGGSSASDAEQKRVNGTTNGVANGAAEVNGHSHTNGIEVQAAQ